MRITTAVIVAGMLVGLSAAARGQGAGAPAETSAPAREVAK